MRLAARVALHSKGKKQARQVGHYDYSQATSLHWTRACQETRKATGRGASYPWTMLTALQSGAKLLIWAHNRWVLVRLGAGDVALFRYDVWHAGASYDCEHWRLHEYWEPTDADPAEWRFREDETGTNGLHEIETKESWRPPTEIFTDPACVYDGPRYELDRYLSGEIVIGELC